jgi:hypothetical protein
VKLLLQLRNLVTQADACNNRPLGNTDPGTIGIRCRVEKLEYDGAKIQQSPAKHGFMLETT